MKKDESAAIESTVKNAVVQGALSYNVSLTYLAFKRLFDITVSLLSLILLLPVFIVIFAVIKLDSQGPAIFVQKRCGFKGKIFKMYKFRSMIMNAEQLQNGLDHLNAAGERMFKVKNDPRVTRVGRFIRRTSLDELPQLFNVLKGDMSIVGPRPPIVSEVDSYDKWHYLRMSVRPGMTGLWQVKCRNRAGFDEMVRLDMKYIRERSFWLDLRIIIGTIPLVFGDRRAL